MNLGHRIEPIPALIFDHHKAGPLSKLIAPPYDLIDSSRQEGLYGQSPYNVVRLELNRESEPYESAARTLKEWLSNGIVTRLAPALFVYTQSFIHNGRTWSRRALMARVRLEEYPGGRISPHERTFPKAKEDRLRLLEATRTNISPVFGLYPSGYDEVDRILNAISKRPPQLAAADENGVDHQVRAIHSAVEIEIIQEALANARILIADGHHRYETAVGYQKLRHATEPAGRGLGPYPYDYVMMGLVAFDDPGLVILPTHRVIRDLNAEQLSKFKRYNGAHFQSEEFDDPRAMLAKLREFGSGYIGAFVKGTLPRILRIRNYDVMDHARPYDPQVVRELDVTILHALVFDEIFGITPENVSRGRRIEYTIDAESALISVQAGTAAGAFFLNPSSVEEIEKVAKAGATMPEKSTYFHPKLATGLLMNPLE